MALELLRLTTDEPDSSADGYLKDKFLRRGEGHDWMGHDCGILTLVVWGRLEEGFAGERQRCSSWELHYKPPGALHTTTAGPDGTRMLLVGLRAPALARLDVEIDDAPRPLGGGIRAARALVMFAELGLDRHGTRRLAPALVERLLRVPTAKTEKNRARRPGWIREVHERVVVASERDRGLDRLAEDFRVHPVYLARAFRNHYGESIGAARRRARVERAVMRLTRGSESLSRLAAELGYCDQSHFTREFKQMTGSPPGRFRRTVAALGRPGPADASVGAT